MNDKYAEGARTEEEDRGCSQEQAGAGRLLLAVAQSYEALSSSELRMEAQKTDPVSGCQEAGLDHQVIVDAYYLRSIFAASYTQKKKQKTLRSEHFLSGKWFRE